TGASGGTARLGGTPRTRRRPRRSVRAMAHSGGMAGRGVPFPSRLSRRPRRPRRLHDAARERTLAALIAVASLAAVPLTAAAAPTPSPSLDRFLAPPPTAAFVADTESAGT